MINQTECKKIRYEMRNEIENIIKENNMDRELFHEVAKLDYKKVLNKVYYSFCDYQKYPAVQVSSYMWVRFRKELKRTKPIRVKWDDWDTYIDHIDQMICEKNPSILYYLLVDGGWVYEGTIMGIKQVLYHFPVWMEDFYIIPRDYSWIISHCEDGGCMVKLWS